MISLLLTLITIYGRTNEPLYEAEIPSHWTRGPRDTLIEDTTLPIASFKSDDGLSVTIHNFPNIPIAPQSQVERWIRQLGNKQTSLTQTTHGGFVGLILESDQLLAAAFQLAPHYKRLPIEEKTSDWTIKATGSIDTHRPYLLKLIHSFQTIEPLQILEN